jgi:hypothetical protein
MWMQMGTEMDQALPIEEHRPDDVQTVFSSGYSNWAFLADHVGKDL